MSPSTDKKDLKSNLISQLNSFGDTFLSNKREEKSTLLSQIEIPTTREEYWKYTRVSKFLKTDFITSKLDESIDTSKYVIDPTLYTLVFINGHFSPKLSNIKNIKGVQLKTIAKAKTENASDFKNHFGKAVSDSLEFFNVLNDVYCQDGIFLKVDDNMQLETPIHILNVENTSQNFNTKRNLVIIGKHAEVELIQTFETENGGSFTNSMTEIFMEEEANFSTVIYQNESNTSSQINTTEVIQKDKSIFSIATITPNGEMVRNNLNIKVDGEFCETNLYGMYLTKGNSHVDNHTRVDHIRPNCNSNETYKGILTDKSTGVFNGKVFVRQEAQKTNAFQSNKNILLSDLSSVNSKPELEIYADDVKCSHGSTTGQFDDEAMFYLRTRGIGKDNAHKLLVRAYASDVINNIKNEKLREKIEERINAFFE